MPSVKVDVEYDDIRDCPDQSTRTVQVIEVEDFLDSQRPDGKYFVPLETSLTSSLRHSLPHRRRNAL